MIDVTIQLTEPIPTNAIRVVCDGTNYIVYEEGDELPPEPAHDEQL